ncbi:hypothetical protein CC79DRAFT_1341418 [Sarocladium strictum]
MPGREGQIASPQDANERDDSIRLGSPFQDDLVDGQGADGLNGPDDASPTSDGPARKRRRSRKGLDKRFECSEEGCGKSYSRAEHLYRHQLNHNSKQTFRCDFPNCTRTFVRGDLLKRHKDRHTNKGSQLSRRDSVISHVAQAGQSGSLTSEQQNAVHSFTNGRQPQMMYNSPHEGSATPFTPGSTAQPDVFTNGTSMQGASEYAHDLGYSQSPPQRQDMDLTLNHSRPASGSRMGSYGVMSPVSNQRGYPGQQPQMMRSDNFVPQQSVQPMNLPPAQYPNFQAVGSRAEENTYNTSAAQDYSETSNHMMLDQMAMPGTVPVFGSDGALNKSPYVGMPLDFMNYLFNSEANPAQGSPMSSPIIPVAYTNYGDLNSFSYMGNEHGAAGYFPTGPQQVMAVNNLLEQNVPENTISEEKGQEIFDFIKDRFKEKDQAPIERQREGILDGDRSDPEHMLSTRMMKAYISSYWYHFSDQMPILHKPTFSPERTPTLLLLAMMTIGAACLDRTHGPKVTKAGAQLSNFLAWYLRWEVFMDVNSRPPAKLWIFQTLILLELYEKMYSTRELHERAHIHHATTITLMRRGRSLIGKSAMDSPPNPRDSANGSRHSSTSGAARTPEEWWNDWITSEATRRVAFAAFVIDSIHATMFGHSAFMVAHEMRLPLPCDESLWRATSSAEVGRVESNLMSRGIKPMSFLEGLKRTLSGQEVRTNSFGRTVLMAGLLSVTWHMHQRDLQVNVLGGGVVVALGGRDKWRATLTKAFDEWKSDFDKALQRNESAMEQYRYDKNEYNIVFESRTVLHHLAHMAMHADIVDCQMFARAKRLLGRTIGPQEFNSAQRRIKDVWAPSAKARDATFYALKFLCSVLVPDSTEHGLASGHFYDEQYEAREDVLLNRAWVLYFAALVVWCYGYALEGSCWKIPAPTTRAEKNQQMRDYLLKFGKIADPNELRPLTGVNQNTALLMVLKDSFETTRWELLQEGSNLLNNCIVLNCEGALG